MGKEDAKWHWGEGLKYAHELLKSLLIINGAAAVSMLTFIGSTKLLNGPIIVGMISFGLGVAFAVLAMLGAYLTQLHYGNAEVPSHNSSIWRTAGVFHNVTYAAGLSSLFLFGAGIASVGWGAFIVSSAPKDPSTAMQMAYLAL